MERKLERLSSVVYHYDAEGIKVEGPHSRISGDVTGINGDVTRLRGDVSGLRGDVSGLRGDVSGLRGDVSGLWGDVTGLWGDATGISGDVDDCGITAEEREKGVAISDLVMAREAGGRGDSMTLSDSDLAAIRERERQTEAIEFSRLLPFEKDRRALLSALDEAREESQRLRAVVDAAVRWQAGKSRGNKEMLDALSALQELGKGKP